MKSPTVTVILSTYNGEKYITEQLDSLLLQSYPNINICIRDDGSTDRTVDLINKYISQHPERQITWLNNSPTHNLGYQKSFWILLQNCPIADYYAFCDQDDVWSPEKVESGVRALEKYENDKPLLYTSSFDYYTSDLHFMGHAQKISYPIYLKDILFYTPAFGFTIMINNTLRTTALSTALKYDNIPHDNWCLKVALAFGNVIYNPIPLAKYRRHNSTVTLSTPAKLRTLLYWFRYQILGNSFQDYYMYTTCFIQEYNSLLTTDDRKLLLLFSKSKTTFSIWFRRLFFPHRLRPTYSGEIALRICFLLNR